MKTNIKKLEDSDLDVSFEYYSWDEICDRCNRPVYPAKFISSKAPDIEECDFCLECLRYLMNEKISYEKASKLYKRE